MRRMTFGSLWSCHINGRDFRSCITESSEKSSSNNSGKVDKNDGFVYAKNGASYNYDANNSEIHKCSRPIATSPLHFFSNAKDASNDISFSPQSHAATFRSRKLTTTTRPYQKIQRSASVNERSSTSSYPARKVMFATEVENLLSAPQKQKSAVVSSVTLPFPQEKVGVFTCHGLEPSEYLHLVDPLTGGMDDLKKSNTEESVDKVTGLSYVIRKINQDRGAVFFPYGKDYESALFGVFDGHGDGGEQVSQYVMTELEKRLYKHPEFETNIHNALKDVFLSIDRSLKYDSPIDPTFCGTTACIVLMRNNTIHVSNIGDSRAVLCRRTPIKRKCSINKDFSKKSQPHKYIRSTIELTQDQNPEVPSEKYRIERSGGYVSPSPEPGVSARVWSNPTHTFLGLAMSRSIGDFFLKRSGVIAEPVVTSFAMNCKSKNTDTTQEISPHGNDSKQRMDHNGHNDDHVTHEDEFLVVASDGVWEYLSSEEVVEVVGKALDQGLGATEACKQLIVTAAMRWKDYDYYYRDDITAIVVKVDGLFDNSD